MCDLQRTMSTCDQYDKDIFEWIQPISKERVKSSGRPPFLMGHHPPTLEVSTQTNKNYCSFKNFTHFDSLSSDLLHTIFIWNLGLIHHNKIKPVLARLTQHKTIICTSTSYKTKYVSFQYWIHCSIIRYVWADRRLGTHTSDHDRKWERAHIINHYPVLSQIIIQDLSTSHPSTSTQISFRHHILTNNVLTYAQFSMHITILIQHFLNCIFLDSFSFTLIPACENSLLHVTHQFTYSCTIVVIYVRVKATLRFYTYSRFNWFQPKMSKFLRELSLYGITKREHKYFGPILIVV